jgi:hypothetical protein
MNHSILKLIIGLTLLVAAHAQICPLCGSSYSVPKRWDYPISSSPRTTCRDKYVELAMMKITDNRCLAGQEQYQDVCCNDEIPSDWDAPPTSPPVSETGNEPMCRICKTDEYPGIPETSINARYVGSYTCGTLYDRGRNGLIPGFMCG